MRAQLDGRQWRVFSPFDPILARQLATATGFRVTQTFERP